MKSCCETLQTRIRKLGEVIWQETKVRVGQAAFEAARLLTTSVDDRAYLLRCIFHKGPTRSNFYSIVKICANGYFLRRIQLEIHLQKQESH